MAKISLSMETGIEGSSSATAGIPSLEVALFGAGSVVDCKLGSLASLGTVLVFLAIGGRGCRAVVLKKLRRILLSSSGDS